MVSSIRASEAAFYIRNRKGYYDGMKTIGYCMPSLHSGLCTLDWMGGVRANIFYCPKNTDRNLQKNCFHPPPKDVLLKKINDVMRPQINDHGGDESIPWKNTLDYMQDH